METVQSLSSSQAKDVEEEDTKEANGEIIAIDGHNRVSSLTQEIKKDVEEVC